MRSIIWTYIVQFLTYLMLISLSEEVALSGKKVRDAQPNELPFVVSIRNEIEHFCAGSLISQRSVLTASHCILQKIAGVRVLIGSNDLCKGQQYKPVSWISYKQWANKTTEFPEYVHDIAVITLKKRVTTVKPAALLTFVFQEHFQKVRIAGWGRYENGTLSMKLQTAVVNILPNAFCRQHIELLLHKSFQIPRYMFCTFAFPWVLGDCGDSGAPILNKNNQVMGIHAGICPASLKNKTCPEEIIKQNLININLHLYHYRRFISDVKQD